jgi:hypothetical protein
VLVDARDGHPIPYGTVILLNTDQERFADAEGAFRFSHLEPGAYSVRARQIGHSPKDTTIRIMPGLVITGVTLRLVPIPLPLPRLVVRPGVCTSPGPPDSTGDPALAGIFTQLRENVNRFQILLDRYPFHFMREDSLVITSPSGDRSRQFIDTTRVESRNFQRYRVGRVLLTVVDFQGRRTKAMKLPEFSDLGDSTFLATHCWSWGGVGTLGGSNTDPMLIIDFIPSDKIQEPDVAGSIYLDSTRLVVRRAVYRLTKPDAANPPLLGLTSITSFREITPLVPVMDSITTYRALEPMPGQVSDTGRFRVVDRGRLLDYKFERQAPGENWIKRPGAPPGLVRAPAMPSEVGPYRLVSGPVADSLAGSLNYRYAQGEHSVDVSLVPYDAGASLREVEDTLDLLYNEYSVALDTLSSLAERNRVKIAFYFHGEDDFHSFQSEDHRHLKDDRYRGYVMSWTWESQDGRERGCDPSFLTQAPIRLGSSCYQQTYALADGLLRIRGHLYGADRTSNGDLPLFSNNLVSAIVSSNQSGEPCTASPCTRVGARP